MIRGKGYRVWDDQNRRYLDAAAASGTLSCGYAHPRLVDAAARQLDMLAHFDFGSGGNAPALALAARLASLRPSRAWRVFYTNSGSEATEASLRIAFDYWVNRGEPRGRVVCFALGYHGSTMLSRSLSSTLQGPADLALPYRITRVKLPFPAQHMRDEAALYALSDLFDQAFKDPSHGGPPAAVVVESLLNVGGGIVLPAGFLQCLRALCTAHGTLMIVDEIFTGFGRTGRMFGFDHDDVDPDMILAGKALSGGYIPLAAVLATERIYGSFQADALFGGLRYGHATSGHATACAVALANLDIITDEGLVENSKLLGRELLSSLDVIRDDVVDVRGLGLCVAVELQTTMRAQKVVSTAQASGLLLRRHGRVVMAVPPLMIDGAGVEEIGELLRFSIRNSV
jgi:adenosylmethionine-8-amino-7-oxononanoate aminotransferase